MSPLFKRCGECLFNFSLVPKLQLGNPLALEALLLDHGAILSVKKQSIAFVTIAFPSRAWEREKKINSVFPLKDKYHRYS